MFGIPLEEFVVEIVMGVPASIGMLWAAWTVGREEAAAVVTIDDTCEAAIVPGTNRRV